MKKYLLMVSFLLEGLLTCFGQHYDLYFHKGLKLSEKKDYPGAIASFSSAIGIRYSREAHFFRGLAYFDMKDTCRFCADMKAATWSDLKMASTNYDNFCLSKKILDKNEQERTIERTRKCDGSKDYQVISDNLQDTSIYFIENDIKIYTYLRTKPEFRGGEENLKYFIARNIRYPVEAQVQGEQGIVIVRARIGTDGTIVSMSTETKHFTWLDQAALDVVEKLEFKPAHLDSEPVHYQMFFPISFILQ